MRIIHIHNFIPDPDPGAAAAVAGAVPVSYCRLAALDVVDLCLGKVDIDRLQGESMIFKRVNIKNSKRMLQYSVPLCVRPSAQSQSPPFSGPSPTVAVAIAVPDPSWRRRRRSLCSQLCRRADVRKMPNQRPKTQSRQQQQQQQQAQTWEEQQQQQQQQDVWRRYQRNSSI